MRSLTISLTAMGAEWHTALPMHKEHLIERTKVSSAVGPRRKLPPDRGAVRLVACEMPDAACVRDVLLVSGR